MNYGCIYVATNTVTGDQYVGQTRQKFATRVYAHKISALKPRFKVHKAIAHYGFENFKFDQVFVAFDFEALNFAEKTIIAEINPAYNMTSGGSGAPGPVSESVKKQRSEQAKKRWANAEWRAKAVAGIRAACSTKEFAEKSSHRLKGRNLAKLRWKNYVKPIQEPKNVSESLKKSWQNLEIRARRIAGLKKALAKPEIKEKFRLANLGRKQTKDSIRKSAQAKHKPLYCNELQCTFLSQKHAAEYFQLGCTAITEALKRKGKVKKAYTLVRVV
jgi:group I intron endonuclease